ncbi:MULTISPECIES: LemA family protein [Paraburkholderia]|uniref:LemA family protein n=1 Tax=Paraburkholderia TaxID=1822464 RepID=UPI002AB7EB39|nr:LemA family protein [Paraburkholderia guartelaensis]
MKTAFAVLGVLALLSTGGSYSPFPPIDEIYANRSLGLVVQAYRERSQVAAELLDVEIHGSSHNAQLVSLALDANAHVLDLSSNSSAPAGSEAFDRYDAAERHLAQTLARLLRASDRDRHLSATPRYRVLKAQLRAIELKIAVARDRYDDDASGYNARLAVFPLRYVAHALNLRPMPTFCELDPPPLPPARPIKAAKKALHV